MSSRIENILSALSEKQKAWKKARDFLTDEQALQVKALYSKWKINTTYSKQEDSTPVRVIDPTDNNLYELITPHTSQAGWEPHAVPALWKQISLDEYPEWVQPISAETSYPKNAKCTHNNKKWISDVNDNVWEPGVYGWSEVTGNI